jgi:hypothetical protein
LQSFLAELAQKNTGAIRCLCFSAEAAGYRCPSESFGGRGETRERLFVSHDSLHGECHGLVRAVPGSDAHFTAPAKRKLAHIDRLLQRGEVGRGQSSRPVRCATTGNERQQQQQNPMSVDHGRQFSGTYSPSWASIFSKVDSNKFHIASPLSGLPISTIRLLRSSKND